MTVETNAGSIPGFTAENAIYKTLAPYRMAGVPEHQVDPKSTRVGPAMLRFPWACLGCVLLPPGPAQVFCFLVCDEGTARYSVEQTYLL
jgi:hypothetical protein